MTIKQLIKETIFIMIFLYIITCLILLFVDVIYKTMLVILSNIGVVAIIYCIT